MAKILWSPGLNLGIDIIDQQHRRIVDYINQLDFVPATREGEAIRGLRGLIEELVDYTQSHFGFEEALMEEAGYQYSRPHKRVHDLFTRRIDEYRARLDAGEDIGENLQCTLSTWLVNHIMREDRHYVGTVMAWQNKISVAQASEQHTWVKNTVEKFFVVK